MSVYRLILWGEASVLYAQSDHGHHPVLLTMPGPEICPAGFQVLAPPPTQETFCEDRLGPGLVSGTYINCYPCPALPSSPSQGRERQKSCRCSARTGEWPYSRGQLCEMSEAEKRGDTVEITEKFKTTQGSTYYLPREEKRKQLLGKWLSRFLPILGNYWASFI